jgi:hypothetical protein
MLTGYRTMVNSSPDIHAEEQGACLPGATGHAFAYSKELASIRPTDESAG